MHIEQLRDQALSLPAVCETQPFGEDTLVFKVGGKMFLLLRLSQAADQLCFNVKCDPEEAISLREEYEDTVMPGYHMNKKHWNTVYANRRLSDTALIAMIQESYALVVAGLSAAQRALLQHPQ